MTCQDVRVVKSGVTRFMGALVQSFGGGPLESTSIKKIDFSGWQGPL